MSNLPNVSAILPCGYGEKYVGMALQCFVDQTYKGQLELVIVDNNPRSNEFEVCASVPDELSDRLDVKYVRCQRMSVGALRNLGTAHASGEICITWDEDDASATNRIPTIFVGPMVRPGKYGQKITHYNVLRTLEAMYGLGYLGHASSVLTINNVWQ